MKLHITEPTKLIVTLAGIASVTILLALGKLQEHGGLEILLYLIGYGVGGTFGPKITKVKEPQESSSGSGPS